MKFATIIALSALATAYAHPVPTCEDQSPCVQFTYEKVASENCDVDECEFLVCMKIDLRACPMTPNIAHTCVKPDDQCMDGGGFAGVSTQVDFISTGHTQCQVVPPGGVAEFLLKDGNAAIKGGCGTASKDFQDVTAQCGAFGQRSCAGRAMVGKECVWTVKAPETCANRGGGNGDPHIKKWDAERFSYHGECDLLLLHNEEFADNTGIEIQIRTTIVDFYSYIESAALRIGDVVLEMTMDHFWINGVEGSDEALPMKIGDYILNEPTAKGTAKLYRVDLGEDDFVDFRLYKSFLSVDVAGNRERFENSVGLLGDYNSGAMVGRGGQVYEPTRANEYGADWQVRGDEKMLFRETREPQLPHATCIMPAATSRHLSASAAEVSAARQACASKGPEDFEFCVTDVLATGDTGMAAAW